MDARLSFRTAGCILTGRDITDRKRLEGELRHLAFHDTLTGLANRALFEDRLKHALERLSRRGGGLAVLFVDLDDFKTVNDSLGHAAGDELLRRRRRAAARRACAAPTRAARLGGDEFAILLEDVDERRRGARARPAAARHARAAVRHREAATSP